MRVCMLVRNACVRDARVLREAAALAEASHDVVVLATMEPGLDRVEHRDGFRIERIEPLPPALRTAARIVFRRPVIATQTAGGEPSAGGSAGPAPRRPSPLIAYRDRVISRAFSAAAVATKADAYHAHDLNTLAAASSAARRRGARLVYDAHELYSELSGFSPAEKARWERAERELIRRPDRIVTVSEGIAEELARRYGITEPEVLLNCPARPGRSPDPSRSPLHALRRPGEVLVLYAGGMSANRGLEALAHAARSARGWRLAMMGWGRLERTLREMAPTVAFVPPVPPESIVDASAAADVGVIPYLPVGLNNALSMPNKLFDYVHAGLAVAASDLVQIRKFLDRWGVGATFTPGDPASIASVLDGLAADPGRLASMRAATDEAAAACDWNIEKNKLVAIYDRLGHQNV